VKKIVDFMVKREGKAWKDLCVLFLLFGTTLFQFLGRIPLLEPDEGRYAEIPREMLEKADFITPYLNHVKYFEKPPLLYWLNSLSFSIFGQNEFAARFFPALCGLLGILLTYHVGRKVYGRREGFLAAIVLGTSVGYIAQSRMNIIDIPLTLCMTATLGFFLLAVREGERRKDFYYYLFYISAALTVLAKGLIGVVLPGGVIVLYVAVARKWRIFREMRLVTGGLLFLLVAAPWFVVVSLRNPEFARFFFIHEHFERFLTKVHGHYKPAWYFIPVLLGCMFPWSLFLPAAFRRLWSRRNRAEESPTLFLAIWALVIFIFFSLSDSKLMPYILPVFPAVALLVGRTLSGFMEEGLRTARMDAHVTAISAFLLGLGTFLYPILVRNSKLEIEAVIVLGSLLSIGGATAMVYMRKERAPDFVAALSAMSLLVAMAGPPFIFGRLAERKATPELAQIVKRNFREGDKIACYGWYQQGLPFYTGERVIVVGYKGELSFGSDQGDNAAWFLSPDDFNRLWDSHVRVFTLIKKTDMELLRTSVQTPVRILGLKGDKMIIANR
jgi:4-amino-4-deoxy-L-arabinose transferase-like glycosyltransferase